MIIIMGQDNLVRVVVRVAAQGCWFDSLRDCVKVSFHGSLPCECVSEWVNECSTVKIFGQVQKSALSIETIHIHYYF